MVDQALVWVFGGHWCHSLRWGTWTKQFPSFPGPLFFPMVLPSFHNLEFFFPGRTFLCNEMEAKKGGRDVYPNGPWSQPLNILPGWDSAEDRGHGGLGQKLPMMATLCAPQEKHLKMLPKLHCYSASLEGIEGKMNTVCKQYLGQTPITRNWAKRRPESETTVLFL